MKYNPYFFVVPVLLLFNNIEERMINRKKWCGINKKRVGLLKKKRKNNHGLVTAIPCWTHGRKWFVSEMIVKISIFSHCQIRWKIRVISESESYVTRERESKWNSKNTKHDRLRILLNFSFWTASLESVSDREKERESACFGSDYIQIIAAQSNLQSLKMKKPNRRSKRTSVADSSPSAKDGNDYQHYEKRVRDLEKENEALKVTVLFRILSFCDLKVFYVISETFFYSWEKNVDK